MTTTEQQNQLSKAMDLIKDYKNLVQDLKELVAAHKAQIAVYENLTNHWFKALTNNNVEEVITSMHKIINIKDKEQ
jgi:hypothetical protein